MEQAAEEEKAALKRERKELYKIQREKLAHLRRIEFKIERVSIVCLRDIYFFTISKKIKYFLFYSIKNGKNLINF